MKKVLFIIAIFIVMPCFAFGQDTLTLRQACQLALKNSVKLETLKSKIQSSRMIIHERWRDLLPHVTVQYTKSDDVAVREQDVRTQSLMGTVNYDIFTNGKAFIAYSIAQIESMLAVKEYTIEKNKIILTTKQAYFDLQKKKKSMSFL